MNQAAKFDLSIIGMPKKDRAGKGWIGFGPKDGSSDQERQRVISKKKKKTIKWSI